MFSDPIARRDAKRRLARTGPGVAVEPLEGRQLLSHMGTLPGRHGDHHAEVSTRDERHDRDDGGVVRKAPHYFEIFDNIGKRPDLNVVRASVRLNQEKGVFVFEGRMQGKINTAPADASQDSLYVFGVNRGSPKAIAPFALRQGVRFDAVVVVSINHATGISAMVVDIANGTSTPLPADHIHIGGHTVRVDVDAALLPTPAGGVGARHYTFNLWPRESFGPDSTIASFIPENSMAPIAVEGHRHGG